MKEEVVSILKKALKKKGIKISEEEITKKIEMPTSADFGDYSFPCHFLCEEMKMSPHQISLEIREEIENPPELDFEDIQTKNGYINFFVERKSMAQDVIWNAITKKEKFGIGHLRSTIIGNAISNILEFQGYKVKRINYLGDWGTQFGKLLFGYEKFGSESKLEKDGINHLFDIYVKSNKKSYEKFSREKFQEMEKGNRKELMLWKIFRGISLDSFKKIYDYFGIKFDAYSGESKYNKKNERIKKELDKRKLLKKSRGALLVDLKKYGLDVLLIEKKDGTTLYSTRDLAAAIDRYEKYKFDRMIYEVGQEQKFYFQQLFQTLKLMDYKWAEKCVHIYHGHYLGEDGKKFATRKGKTVLMEKILEKTITLAEKKIIEREPKISKLELEKRAKSLAIAAIFYNDLKNNRESNIKFDIESILSFEGNTGPYLLYSYARATSLLEKSKSTEKYELPKKLEEKEIDLVRHLSLFPEVAREAGDNLNPSIVADYAYKLCKIFNEFYHSSKVIGSEDESFKLALIEAFRQILKNSLSLLGISPLSRM
jgi:arginyl-tRNA synthetase